MRLATLDEAIKQVAPIDGVSMGRKDDPKTWRIDFRPEATAEQIAAATALLQQFDPNAPDNDPPIVPAEDRLAAIEAALIAKGILAKEDIDAKLSEAATLVADSMD